MSSGDRVPPQALDIERTVLGSIMVDHAVAEIAFGLLGDVVFYHGGHRKIFQCMQKLFEKNVPIDLVTLRNGLNQRGCLEEIGSEEYLATIVESITTSGNIEHYCKILRAKAILRGLITAAGEITSKCFDPDIDPEDALEMASAKVFEVGIFNNAVCPVFTAAEMVRETYGEMERVSKGGVVGVTTGYREIDDVIIGLCRPDFIVVGGRPGSGKTSLALNFMMRQTIVHKIPILFFSIEMSKLGLGQRAFSIESGVGLYAIRQGAVRGNSILDVSQAASRISEAPLYCSDASGINLNQIRSVTKRCIRQYGIEAVYIDHTRLMRHSGRNPIDGMTEISHGLKTLAKEVQRPIIALHQLSRPMKGSKIKKPQLSDLRDSGAVEEDADMVIFVHRDFYYTKKEEDKFKAEVIVEKARNGPTGSIMLKWTAANTIFSEQDGEEW